MTLRKIAQIGHPVLRQRAREVTPEELASESTQAFIDDLVETMRDANGAGLAAIQIYEPVRICALEVKDNPRYPYKPNIPLTIGFIIIVITVANHGYRHVTDVLSSPLVAIVLALMVISMTVHMRIGMQVVIEDYVHGTVSRQIAMIANTFFTVAVGAVSIFAILKLALGG